MDQAPIGARVPTVVISGRNLVRLAVGAFAESARKIPSVIFVRAAEHSQFPGNPGGSAVVSLECGVRVFLHPLRWAGNVTATGTETARGVPPGPDLPRRPVRGRSGPVADFSRHAVDADRFSWSGPRPECPSRARNRGLVRSSAGCGGPAAQRPRRGQRPGDCGTCGHCGTCGYGRKGVSVRPARLVG
ncbi:hypothetical protein Francci3_4229 [Frankia casuarinae]|uniref:Uncharacterized protein n=1 Tax=Frankia casuarinae (strain DSM 45818 / CECT 9043 / HFP020203 / CcI3) TaxID=106370 RepID=Q2J567_FRACC|nr:hypothetical protein Francci3_4229 [Frankia casuarinae]